MAKKISRTTNTLFNFTSSIGGQLLTIIMQFVVRTFFINTLGKSYLGISGLFSNILSMLSLAELGVGSAILFKLYEPIAVDNRRRITVLMKFYKRVYMFIGAIIAVLGCCLIPFLPFLIKDYDRLETLHINAVFVYLLYLLQSVSSYLFFAYKSAIVKAHQKEYLLNLAKYAVTIISSIVQIILLVTMKSFIVYVMVLIGTVIFENCVYAVIANRMYPYIKEETDEKLSREEVRGVFKDCSALLLYKLNGVVLKATDNIVLSTFIGLEIVGLYTNYYVFYTTINTLFAKVFGSVSHSLGNLHATSTKEHEYTIFRAVNLITMILGGTAGVGIFVCADDFVLNWIGQEWVIPQPFSLLMGLEIVTLAIRVALSKYRTTMGLFQQAKYRPLFGMIINLVVSVVLVRYWGICGVLVGTLAADWLTFMWYDPIIIHKYGFKNEALTKGYFYRLIKYLIIVAGVGAMDYFICREFFIGMGWASVVIHAVICGVTVPLALILLNIRHPEGGYVLTLINNYKKKILKKVKRGEK